MKYPPATIPDAPKPRETMAATAAMKVAPPMTKSTKTMVEVRSRIAAVFLEIWKTVFLRSKSATKRVGYCLGVG